MAGIIGGLAAGVVFGLMMQMMTTPEGDPMVAMVLRSENLFVGWIYHHFNSAVIGLIFGVLASGRITRYPAALGSGAAYGVTWWGLGALIIMPVLLGMAPFAPLMMEEMVPVAMGSLVGHLVYGLILGAAFLALVRSEAMAPIRSTGQGSGGMGARA